jgi:hypothetical protein
LQETASLLKKGFNDIVDSFTDDLATLESAENDKVILNPTPPSIVTLNLSQSVTSNNSESSPSPPALRSVGNVQPLIPPMSAPSTPPLFYLSAKEVCELFEAFGELMASAWDSLWQSMKKVKDSVGNAIEEIKEWGKTLWRRIKCLFLCFNTLY